MRESAPEVPEDVVVKLKPILGVQPTTYLPVFYGIMAVVVLFLILVLPGIVRPGTLFTVNSTPDNAAVSVDTVVLGATGGEVFVRAGERVIEVSKPGHELHSEALLVRRRLVGSLFFPRRQTLVIDLQAIAQRDLVAAAVKAYSQWALFGEASGQYQFPPVARELGRDLAGLGSPAAYDAFTRTAIAHVDSEAQMNDLLSGALLANSGGSPPGALSVAAVVQIAARVAAASPGLAIQMEALLGSRRSEMVRESEWGAMAERQMAGLDSEPRVLPAQVRAASRTISGIGFLEIPAGAGVVAGNPRAERGGDIAYSVQVEPFLVSQTEVTVADYSRFVTSVPEWGPENREALISNGLVDREYLRDWEDGVPMATAPVRNVSAFAAEAFAAWLSTSIAPTGLVARLPTEAEWDYLLALDAPETGVFASATTGGPAAVGESGRGRAGLYGLLGNVWEWTSDPFATYGRLHPLSAAETSWADASHRTVRGGGWASLESDFDRDDRGSMPPDWCSGAVGFRLVLSEE